MRIIKQTLSDRMFLIFVYIVLGMATIITLYPFLYTLSMSISSAEAVLKNQVTLFPIGFTLDAYAKILQDKDFYIGYYNTIIYTLIGTVLNMMFTIAAAYPLSRKQFFGRRFFTIMFAFTMFFGGGMIPAFILVSNLNLYNTRWAIWLPGLINTWNMIIARTYMQSMPEDLYESGKIDGCSDFRYLWQILLPLIKPVLAVLIIYYGVAHWNSWFSAILYLNRNELMPVQVYLRRLVLQASNEIQLSSGAMVSGESTLGMLQVRYAAIFAVCLPILCIYPFFQKYFVKGTMIGAIKG